MARFTFPKRVVLAAAACSMLSSLASAAVITGTPIAAPSLPANLTTLGTTAWAYWDANANAATTIAPTNTKSGATMIGVAHPVGTTAKVRGSGSTLTTASFSFTNGTFPTSSGGTVVHGV